MEVFCHRRTMNRHIHQITQGALLCALEGVLLVINRQLAGVLDSYLIWVIPLPLIVYSSKYGLKDSLWVALSLVLLSFIIANPVTIFYVAGSALIGCVYGYGLGKGKSNAWLLITAILGSLVMTYLTCVIFAGFFGYSAEAVRDKLLAYREDMGAVIAQKNEKLQKMGYSEYIKMLEGK